MILEKDLEKEKMYFISIEYGGFPCIYLESSKKEHKFFHQYHEEIKIISFNQKSIDFVNEKNLPKVLISRDLEKSESLKEKEDPVKYKKLKELWEAQN